MSLAGAIRRHDADGTARRRALRATIVVPALFAATLTFGSDTMALYVLFGAFSHLVFGDYGGPCGCGRAATWPPPSSGSSSS